jgi:cytochrome c2
MKPARSSWRRAVLAIAAAACAAPSASHTAAVSPPAPPPAGQRLFVRLGCNDCHAVSALGVRAEHDVGPDLTFAYGDVVTRYGVNLETFLANPSGVMRLMLGAHLNLTASDRDSVVAILKALHVEHRAAAFPP